MVTDQPIPEDNTPRWRRRYRYVGYIIAIGLAGSVLIVAMVVNSGPSGVVEVSGFEADAWRSLSYVNLLFRYESPGDDDFLILPYLGPYPDLSQDDEKVETVYRYESASGTFQALGIQAWEDAAGPITAALFRLNNTRGADLYVDRPTDKLYLGNRVIPTAGWATLTVHVSPNKQFVSVVSADGRRPLSLLSRPNPSGPYYQQILKFPEMTQVGPTLRLPSGPASGDWWAPDERYLIRGVGRIIVIPVGTEGENN